MKWVTIVGYTILFTIHLLVTLPILTALRKEIGFVILLLLLAILDVPKMVEIVGMFWWKILWIILMMGVWKVLPKDNL